MHAFLIIGEGEKVNEELGLLTKKIGATKLEFPISKIADVRDLNHFISLSFSSPTLIVVNNFNEITEEAQNALLKNLEEPQKNIYFALCTSSLGQVLPTIVSRCQVIRVHSTKYTALSTQYEVQSEDAGKFLSLTEKGKIEGLDKIKDRKVAIEFAESLVNFLHSKLHGNKVKYSVIASQIEVLQKTIACLKANGNVNLHLLKLAIDLG